MSKEGAYEAAELLMEGLGLPPVGEDTLETVLRRLAGAAAGGALRYRNPPPPREDAADAQVAARARNHGPAQAARMAGREVADLVFQKQLAYGNAAGIQLGLWQALLKQYEDIDPDTGAEVYIMPRALMDHVPRLTRVFDRVCRIVSNPVEDAMGESPWRDMCGDAMVGITMPRSSDSELCGYLGCERKPGHKGLHRRAHSGGVDEWPDAGQVAERVLAQGTANPNGEESP